MATHTRFRAASILFDSRTRTWNLGSLISGPNLVMRAKKLFSSLGGSGKSYGMSLLDPLFRWEAVDQHFSDRARLQGMLDFEAALARAEASTGAIPAAAAPAIACAAALSGSPAIPLVKELTVLVAKDAPDAARRKKSSVEGD
jgi:hypothetical protein